MQNRYLLILFANAVATLGFGQSALNIEEGRGSLYSLLQPNASISLSVLTEGIVKDYLVEEGQAVQVGDVILELVHDEEIVRIKQAEASLLGAQAERERAEKALARSKELRAQSIQSDKDFELAEYEAKRARAMVLQAESTLELAKVMLERKKVRSTIDGILLKAYKMPGESVNGLETIARVLNADSLEMVVHAGAEYWGRFKKNASVEVEVSTKGGGAKKVKGSIQFIDPVIDPVAGTFRVKIGLRSSEDVIVGLPARILVD